MKKSGQKSILTTDWEHCFICGKYGENLHTHHVMEGTGNRKIADKYGLIIPLCYECHEGADGVHKQPKRYEYLKAFAQRMFERQYPRSEWMEHFKNYL